ncbi:DsbA family protein [Magnetospira thiophila]
MRKIYLCLVVIFALAMASTARAAGYEELSMGRADAPVTIVDYSSLTCPHCAAFHTTTLEQIKKDYVETGKVRIVFTDFPFEGVGFRAAVAVRCADPLARQGLLDLLFKTQNDWTHSPDPVAAMLKVTRLAGLTEEKFNACLADTALTEGIISRLQDAQKTHGVTSTPTFLINGEKLVGSEPYDVFQAAIDKALAAAGVK